VNERKLLHERSIRSLVQSIGSSDQSIRCSTEPDGWDVPDALSCIVPFGSI
jgi:hypothetical protein